MTDTNDQDFHGGTMQRFPPPAPEPAMPREDVEKASLLNKIDGLEMAATSWQKTAERVTKEREDWKAKCEKAEAANAQARADLDNLEQSDAAVFQTTIRTLARLLTEAEARRP